MSIGTINREMRRNFDKAVRLEVFKAQHGIQVDCAHGGTQASAHFMAWMQGNTACGLGETPQEAVTRLCEKLKIKPNF